MLTRLVLSFCVVVLAGYAQSPAPSAAAARDAKEIRLGEDEAGCKDSLLLPRIPGCSIIQCDSKESASFDIHIGASTDGAPQKEMMEGPAEVIYYLCPARTTLPQIVKLSEAVLAKGGYKTVYNGKDDDEQPLLTAVKDMQFIQVSTYMYNEYTAYIQTAIRDTAETQASSESLAEEMAKSGRVSLPNVTFPSHKAELPADAEKDLTEVAAMLVRQPDWKIRVEANAEEAADKQANLALSQQRASAVAAWLLEHGIAPTRVSILAVGDARAAGTRTGAIELVKF